MYDEIHVNHLKIFNANLQAKHIKPVSDLIFNKDLSSPAHEKLCRFFHKHPLFTYEEAAKAKKSRVSGVELSRTPAHLFTNSAEDEESPLSQFIHVVSASLFLDFITAF